MNLLLVFALAVCCLHQSHAGEQMVFHHVTCERDYKKMGCFRNQQHIFKDILMQTHGHNTDWNAFGEHLHNMACLCHKKASEGQYSYFAIGNYGTCYGGKDRAAFEAVLKDASQQSNECLSGNWYEDCDVNDNDECSGGAESVFVYEFTAAIPTQPAPVDGGFSGWSDWTPCSKSCGKGTQERERTCTEPEPSNRGKDCSVLGEYSETRECKLADCELDWTKYNSHMYHFSSLKKTFDEAEEFCNQHGGHLASIHDDGESEYIKAEGKKRLINMPYVGGTDVDREKTWKWTDGTKMTYKRWRKDEPNNLNGREHCLIVGIGDVGANWLDVTCTGKRNFVCKMTYYHGNTYFIATEKKNFDHAERHCVSMKGHLTSIHSKAENDFLVAELNKRDIVAPWIGFEDREEEGKFKWVDGTDNSYTRWSKNEPNNLRQEHCSVMKWKASYWNDEHCTDKRAFVCKLSTPVTAYATKREMKPFGDAVYFFSEDKLSWQSAEKDCQKFGGHLASVHSAEENEFIINNKKSSSSHWIGGSDIAREGKWVWSDATKLSYKAWYPPKEPNNLRHEDCMTDGFHKQYWNDYVCARALQYVCKNLYHNGNQYFISTEKLNRDDAERKCVALGGHLTSIHNQAENDFLYNEVKKRGYGWVYMGLSDRNWEGTFTWSDGSPVSYTKWHRKEPNNIGGGEDCAHINFRGNYWNDIKCRNKYYFICKF